MQLFGKLNKLREKYKSQELTVEVVFEFNSVKERQVHVAEVHAKLRQMRGRTKR